MKEVVTTTAVAAGTGVISWILAKMQTRRERKKSDIQLINESVQPLLLSIKALTEQNNDTVCKLLAEQDKSLKLIEEKSKWQAERHELIEKIDGLEKKIQHLQKTINKYIKNNEE
jgi:chromosome segregation ATPase